MPVKGIERYRFKFNILLSHIEDPWERGWNSASGVLQLSPGMWL